jgi:hypothetical protein
MLEHEFVLLLQPAGDMAGFLCKFGKFLVPQVSLEGS